MFRQLYLLTALMILVPVCAGADGFAGYVRDPLDRPVPGVVVHQTIVGDIVTNSNGRYECNGYVTFPYIGRDITVWPSSSYYGFIPGSYTQHIPSGNCYEQNFTRTNNAPEISFTGEDNYTEGGVFPTVEASSSAYTFRMQYKDVNNDPPASGYPRVRIKKSTTTISLLTMDYAGGEYASGAVYYTAALLAPCSFYSYVFEANDDFSTAASIGEQSGPQVLAYISGTVRDIDGTPMADMPVSLGGTVSSATLTDTEGRYIFSMLPAGTAYTVNTLPGFAPVSISTMLADNLDNADFIKDNTGAKLDWTGEPGYESDAVSPAIGAPESPFEFRVAYSDAENDPPADGFPKLHIRRAGTEIIGSPFAMTAADGSPDYTNRKIYRYGATIADIGINYSYYITVQDSRSVAITSTTIVLIGPTVSHQPTLTWTGSDGYTADGINPDTGTVSANYVFRIRYTDVDNLPPASGYPRVHIYKSGTDIAGSPFAMSYISGNHNTGSVYTYERTLPLGMDYTYSFEAQNQYLYAAVPRGGYGPQVRSKISGYVRDPSGNPLGDVTLTLSGTESGSYTTASDGHYEFLITTEAFTVTPSSYSWYTFTPYHRNYTGQQIDSGTENYTRNTGVPVLSFTGETDYESSAVYPQVARSSDTLVFRVRYQNPGNDAPAAGYPRVVIYKGGSVIRTLPMGYVSGDYRVSGAVYSTGTLLAPCSYYTYAIEALDIFNSPAAPLTASGPDVRAYIAGRVYDADGGPMQGVTVSLTGDVFQETQSAPDGTFLLTMLPGGGNYSLTPSSHTYYTFTPAVFSAVLNDNLPGVELHRDNTAPALSWSAEAEYNGQRGVWPATGTTNSDLFTFKTVFTDPDDDGYKSLNLYLKKDSVVLSTIPVSDCYGSFHSGLTCGYSTLISTSGVYSYRFGAVGRWNEVVATPELGFLSMIAPTAPVNDGAVIADNQSVVSAEVTLKWSAADPEGGPLLYDLYVSPTAAQVLGAGRTAGYSPAAAVPVYSGPGTTYTLRNLTPGRMYYWKVNATNRYGVTTQGTLMNFQTLDLPLDKIFNYPNPFNPARQQTNIVFSVASAQTVKIRIYGEYGDLVRVLETEAAAGTNELRFDGRDKNGRMLFNGSYIAVIERAEGPAKCYLLIVK